MASEDHELTAAQVTDELSRAAKVLVRRFDDRLGEHGLSTPRSRVVAEVARSEPVRLTALANAVGIAQGTASTLVEALVRDGLLEREVSDEDRRAVLIRTTEAGAAFARTWTRTYEKAADELFAPLPREQWPAFVAMLRALSAV
jgi:DNA-binding MarR family transcriptional regulator